MIESFQHYMVGNRLDNELILSIPSQPGYLRGNLPPITTNRKTFLIYDRNSAGINNDKRLKEVKFSLQIYY